MNTTHIVLAIIIFICLLYLWLIVPRLFSRPDITFLKRYHYAHRGFHNESVPENSMTAFALAKKNDYGIELDVRLSKDGVAVVFHDETLTRMCGTPGKVSDYTLSELKSFLLLNSEETIPTLSEVLTLINGEVPLLIELKANKDATALCEAVNRCTLEYSGKYCIQSFYPEVLRWYRINRPDIARGQLSERFGGKKLFSHAALSALLTNCYTRPDFISYNCKHPHTLSRIICRRVFHTPSIAWTVRSVKEFMNIKNTFDSYIFEDFTLSNRIL